MLSSIIKVKLEKNCCPFEKLENFFAKGVFHIDDRKRFKEPSVKLVIEHGYNETLTLPREAIPNSFALQLLSSLYRGNALALPIMLKYLVHRNLSKDFDEISKKLQAKMDQDIQEAELQNNSKISKKIEVCKQDILNVLSDGKSVLSDQLKQKYYSILENEVKELKAEISKELEDYTNNTNIHEIYQSLNNKKKNGGLLKEVALGCLGITAIILMLTSVFFFLPIIIAINPPTHMSMHEVTVFRYIAVSPFIVMALTLIIAGVAYLASCYLEHSFAKEMQDFIEGPKYVDKATNTEDVKKLEQEETEVGDYGKKPSAPPYDGPKQPRLYPNLSEVQQPPSYEEACSTVQPKDSQPSSNLDSAEPEQPKLVMDLLESLPEQLNTKLGPVLRPSNTARGVI
ncbi:hypothetical protein NMD99_01840 [Wolbachia endosymbiont of Listronotus oregonensis]|uniref:hypothetical protein n=1 Tax=Wolbachia endosymbiont of Listronotus oregonensis TaxID=2969106 RepID=UPI00281651A6|nr:hypothetical protein [Wolbachia endosymbiont of Listronotus oregonensis]WMT84766.1 hypothetical protein NMD99_01840 [Wolbachia endosymbiont of Listronotus oregonensis]